MGRIPAERRPLSGMGLFVSAGRHSARTGLAVFESIPYPVAVCNETGT